MSEMIYLADDEKNIRDLMESFLSNAGYRVRTFADGDALIAAYEKETPDLVILDIMMPGTDGLTACSLLRQRDPGLPMIIVSARDDPYDRVTGLSLGSDDYLVKPFLPLELVARVKALLRRSEPRRGGMREEALTFGSLTLSEHKRTALLGENPLSLTPMEFDFLAYMIRRGDRAVRRDEILKDLWHLDRQADTRAADDLLKRLRRKLEDRHSDVAIRTVWGYGFQLVKEAPDENV